MDVNEYVRQLRTTSVARQHGVTKADVMYRIELLGVPQALQEKVYKQFKKEYLGGV